MTSPDPAPMLAALGIEPTYSARNAAALLGRSYSWLDQRVRNNQFLRPDGTVVQPFIHPATTRRSSPAQTPLCWTQLTSAALTPNMAPRRCDASCRRSITGLPTPRPLGSNSSWRRPVRT